MSALQRKNALSGLPDSPIRRTAAALPQAGMPQPRQEMLLQQTRGRSCGGAGPAGCSGDTTRGSHTRPGPPSQHQVRSFRARQRSLRPCNQCGECRARAENLPWVCSALCSPGFQEDDFGLGQVASVFKSHTWLGRVSTGLLRS